MTCLNQELHFRMFVWSPLKSFQVLLHSYLTNRFINNRKQTYLERMRQLEEQVHNVHSNCALPCPRWLGGGRNTWGRKGRCWGKTARISARSLTVLERARSSSDRGGMDRRRTWGFVANPWRVPWLKDLFGCYTAMANVRLICCQLALNICWYTNNGKYKLWATRLGTSGGG